MASIPELKALLVSVRSQRDNAALTVTQCDGAIAVLQHLLASEEATEANRTAVARARETAAASAPAAEPVADPASHRPRRPRGRSRKDHPPVNGAPEG